MVLYFNFWPDLKLFFIKIFVSFLIFFVIFLFFVILYFWVLSFFRKYSFYKKFYEKLKEDEKKEFVSDITDLLNLDWRQFLNNFLIFIEKFFQKIYSKNKAAFTFDDMMYAVWFNDWQIKKLKDFIYKDKIDLVFVEELKDFLKDLADKL